MDSVISTPELKALIDARNTLRNKDENEEYVLIDVRRDDELKNGMIPTARHLPLIELEEAFSLSSSDFQNRYGFEKPTQKSLIIVYCRTGGRSHSACDILLRKGYSAKNYKGSIWEWSEIDSTVKRYGLFQ